MKGCSMRYTRSGFTRGILFQSGQGTGVIDDACPGCSTGNGSIKGLLRKRRMLTGCGFGLPVGGHPAVVTLRRTATTSSGYDSFYSKHSTHKHCYMLRSIRETLLSVERVTNADEPREPCNEKKDPLSSQPHTSAHPLQTSDL